MNLEQQVGTGRVLVVQSPRRRNVALGYLLPGFLVIAVACGGLIADVGARDGHPVLGLLAGAAIFLLVLVTLVVPTFAIASSRYLKGRDDGVGLPLAELGPNGVKVRYRIPSLKERRRGIPDPPAFDAAVEWDAVVGWRHGTDPYGQPVMLLDVPDPTKVLRRTGRERLPGDQRLDAYIDTLQRTAGAPIAIRAPIVGPEQVDAVREYLDRHGLTELTGRTPPRP